MYKRQIKGLLASEIATNAIIRTTTAVTTFQSGNETENVLPAQAQAIVNFRLMPGDSITWVVKQVKKIIKDDRVKIEIVGDRNEAPPISDIDTDGFREIQKTIAEVFPGCVISPGMHVGSSDSRYYHSLTENVYRFSPLVATREDVSRVHGNDAVSYTHLRAHET